MDFPFSLVPLIPLLPLLAFAAIIIFTNRNKRLSSGLAIGAIALSSLIGWGAFFAAAAAGKSFSEHPYEISVPWLPAGGSFLQTGFMIDGFTAAMLFMVPFVCLMIFIYSAGYMEGDPRYSRFFAYVSLFAAGMLTLVIANNMILFFIAWEIMGLCSYLLIGFWYEKTYADPKKITPKQAGLKAFLTTRVGDTILLAGICLLYSQTGTLTFSQIFQPETLRKLAETSFQLGPTSLSAATLIALLIFGGAVGKSAQFPLHVWLPDAMEGPTPVSALIHAATMVAAGVYLVARTMPLFMAVEGDPALKWVAVIGAITAFFGATIGLGQNDIKRVLAYSTISQLGYMMMGLGIGGFIAGVFHLLTHAFFKALLFLGSGSVIHGMEHGAHEAHEHGTDAQDMRNMGGLGRRMGTTYWTYIFGTLALVGIVPFAGFWSKDEILSEAFMEWQQTGGLPLPFWVWLAGTLGAFITALYMGRQIGMVFLGQPRTSLAEHAHESNRRMTIPLQILAIFALLIGLANAPFTGNWLHHFIGETHFVTAGIAFKAVPFNFAVAGISTLVALAGLGLGISMYKGLKAGQADPLKSLLGPVYTVLENKYYVDEFYQAVIIRPVVALADWCARFDYEWVINHLVDLVGAFSRKLSDWSGRFDAIVIDRFLVEGTGNAFTWMGRELKYSQSGSVQNYMLVIGITVVMLIGAYLLV
jgi:NADH-quinone oxidoreductase subunit L